MSSNNKNEIQELFGDLKPAREGLTWYAVRTKPRCEKKLAKIAYEYKIFYYLPLLDSENRYKDRTVTFTKPMFPGYIFVKCDLKQKRILTISGYSSHFIAVPRDNVLTAELQEIHSGKEKGANYRIAKFLHKGMRVELIAGPLKGMVGYVKDAKNINKIILKISLLKQAVSVSVRSDQIKFIRKKV